MEWYFVSLSSRMERTCFLNSNIQTSDLAYVCKEFNFNEINAMGQWNGAAYSLENVGCENIYLFIFFN